MKNINKKELFIKLIPLFVTLLCCVVLVSYAYYKIKLEGQKEHFVSSDLISFTYKEGEDKIAVTNVTPVSDTDGKKGNYFEFNVSSNLVKDMSIDYEISILKTSTTNSFSEEDMKAYLTDKDDNMLVDPVVLSTLSDSSKITNAKVIYKNGFTYNNSNEIQTHTYRLRVWLKNDADLSKYTTKTDITDGTNITLPSYSFKFKVNVNTIEQNLDTSGANKPVLASNMIPVYYDEANSVWKKADKNNSQKDYRWYSYTSTGEYKGMWANAVTVKDTNRQTYLNATPGTTIPMDDITTMWVWIPRFNAVTPSNYNGGTKAKPNAIDVTFVKQNETAIDAFTFGTKELSGFWYGKFETSHTTLASSTTANNLGCTNETCSNANGIIIKPNVTNLRWNNVSNFFFASRSMEQPNNSFGFINTEVDTHMSKNNEWGAVAYLTHSIYGRCTDNTTCTEVGINSNVNKQTGYGAPAGSNTSVGTGTYNMTSGKDASTTGNIYGIYDMSGGANEYVMGVYNKTIGSSGFVSLPDEKYYNNYTVTSYSGHALTETQEWYWDSAGYVESSYPWYSRGGMFVDSSSAGVFKFTQANGGRGENMSFHVVISNK